MSHVAFPGPDNRCSRDKCREREKDDRKRKRETALISFERNGSIDGLSNLSITDPANMTCPSAIVRCSYNPTNKGILKTRPILKGAGHGRHKSKSPKKRKVTCTGNLGVRAREAGTVIRMKVFGGYHGNRGAPYHYHRMIYVYI